MLRVAGLRSEVIQVVFDVPVGEWAAKPGAMPKQEREEDQQDREERNQEVGSTPGASGVRLARRVRWLHTLILA